jgi:hypothetical protein
MLRAAFERVQLSPTSDITFSAVAQERKVRKAAGRSNIFTSMLESMYYTYDRPSRQDKISTSGRKRRWYLHTRSHRDDVKKER